MMMPHCLPHCTSAGFGYVDPIIPCPPRVNNPRLHLPCPQPYVLPPPPQQDQEASAQSLLMLRRVTPLKQIKVHPKINILFIINFLLLCIYRYKLFYSVMFIISLRMFLISCFRLFL